MSRLFTRKRLIALAVILVIALIAFFILPVSIPLILAILSAALLDPMVEMLQQRLKVKRKLSVLITFCLFTLILGIGTYFITTKVVGQGVKLIEDFPNYINNATKTWTMIEEKFTNAAEGLPIEMVNAVTDEFSHIFETILVSLKEYINIENISSILSYIPNFLVSFLVYLIALFLFMIDLPRLRLTFYSYMKEETKEKVAFMMARISSVIFGFFKAQFLVSLIILGVSLIGLLIIQPKVAIIMSLVIWVIDLIPIIGSIVILAPWSIYHLLTGNTVLGTQLAVLAAVLLIIRRVVEPKVMGNHIGLSPLATLIAMYLGLKLFGIMGFIIGPLLLILFKTSKEAGLIKMNFKL